MATLKIRKKSLYIWQHFPSDGEVFSISKFYIKTNGDTFKIVEESGSERREYVYNNISVYDDTDMGIEEVFTSPLQLVQRLKDLKYTGFNRDGDVIDVYTIPESDSLFELKLDKDISLLPSISLPILDTDKLIINRGGVDYQVDKSDVVTGGGGAAEYFDFNIPEMVINPLAGGVFVRNLTYNGYYRMNGTATTANHTALTCSGNSALFVAPFDGFISYFSILGGLANGSFSIYKSDSNFSANPVEIIWMPTVVNQATNLYETTSGVTVLKGQVVHVFASQTTTQTWKTILSLRFKKL